MRIVVRGRKEAGDHSAVVRIDIGARFARRGRYFKQALIFLTARRATSLDVDRLMQGLANLEGGLMAGLLAYGSIIDLRKSTFERIVNAFIGVLADNDTQINVGTNPRNNLCYDVARIVTNRE